MIFKKFNFKTIVLFVCFLFFISFLTAHLLSPTDIFAFKNKPRTVSSKNPFYTETSTSADLDISSSFYYLDPLKINAKNSGKYNLDLSFLGIFPLKKVNLNIFESPYVYPSGQSAGIKILTDGVLIISLSTVEDTNGASHNPAKEVGIHVGDIVKSINGEKIKNSRHFSKVVSESEGKLLSITCSRNHTEFTVDIKPITEKESNNYALGMWVRDSTAGLGTITFYTADKKKFAALGHSISDTDTGIIMPVRNGQLSTSTIISVNKSVIGKPGELKGIFDEPEEIIGNISLNNNFGLYGTLSSNKIIPSENPIQVAFKDEIKEGPAKILCTIDKNKVEQFDIEIVKVNNNSAQNTKSLVLAVTDKRLLQKTGGIVQGMSGSPIIQNNKLIGAVTHVFLNDSQKGYGILAEFMLNQTGNY